MTQPYRRNKHPKYRQKYEIPVLSMALSRYIFYLCNKAQKIHSIKFSQGPIFISAEGVAYV